MEPEDEYPEGGECVSCGGDFPELDGDELCDQCAEDHGG